MNRFVDKCCRMLDGVMALALALMVVLVFGNVVLRYAFNSGIAVSEEMSRWLFVWLTFIGAVVAMKERGHLGTDMLVSRLGATGKRACLLLSQLAMLGVTWLLLKGSYVQMMINADTVAPVTGASMAIFYASGVFFSVPVGLMLLIDLWLTATGRISEDRLVMVQESEEAGQVDALYRGREAPSDRDSTPDSLRH
ncbi:MAG TPA: TRAP transporter small permease [Noviherbaspirillum sp.]